MKDYCVYYRWKQHGKAHFGHTAVSARDHKEIRRYFRIHHPHVRITRIIE